jgi:hypothetical protein
MVAMGLFITLQLLPTMSAKAWAAAWEETCEILRQFPIPLCGLEQRDTPFGKRIVDAAPIREGHWRIEGDKVSRRQAETFMLYRDLSRYQRHMQDEWAEKPGIMHLWKKDPSYGYYSLRAPTVFSEKTQGYPFHEAVLAVCMHLERRLPQQVWFNGDISRQQVRRVAAWLSSLLGGETLTPRCFDAPRLWHDLEAAGLSDENLADAFLHFFINERGAAESWLVSQSRPLAIKVIGERLASFSSLRQRGATAILQAILEGSRDLALVFDVIEEASNRRRQAGSFKEDEYGLDLLLQLMIEHGVTTPKWQTGAWAQFSRYTRKDKNVDGMLGQLFTTLSGATLDWSFYMEASELLNHFSTRRPELSATFQETLESSEEKTASRNAEFEAWAKEHAAAEHYPAIEPLPECADVDDFARVVLQNANEQRQKAKDAKADAQKTGRALRAWFLKPDNARGIGAASREQLLSMMGDKLNKSGPILTEEAWTQLDALQSEQDLSLLKVLCLLAMTTAQTMNAHFFTWKTRAFGRS